MKLEKKKVYLPVKVEDELPKIKSNTGMFVMSNIHGWDKLVAHSQMFIPKDGYYLNLQEGYFFTSEQLNEYTANVINKALETAAEEAAVFLSRKEVDKESIIDTFEETFNRFKV